MADERRRATPDSPFEGPIGFSRAVRVGDRVLLSGTGPVWPDGSCDPDVFNQAMRAFKVAGAALSELDAALRDVGRTRMDLLAPADGEAVGRAHNAYFEAVRPAATMVVVAGLLDPRWRVADELEAVAREQVAPRFVAEEQAEVERARAAVNRQRVGAAGERGGIQEVEATDE